MNIVLVNQYYPPDVAPTGCYLHDLARRLTSRGHAVSVLASRASYNGDRRFPAAAPLDAAAVRRVGGLNPGRGRPGLKGIDYGWFLVRLAAALRLLKPEPDFMLCLTTPPFLGVLVRACAGKALPAARSRGPCGHKSRRRSSR